MMAVFIDLKKAYDTVDWETMLDCLEHARGTERSAGSLPGRTVQWGEV